MVEQTEANLVHGLRKSWSANWRRQVSPVLRVLWWAAREASPAVFPPQLQQARGLSRRCAWGPGLQVGAGTVEGPDEGYGERGLETSALSPRTPGSQDRCPCCHWCVEALSQCSRSRNFASISLEVGQIHVTSSGPPAGYGRTLPFRPRARPSGHIGQHHCRGRLLPQCQHCADPAACSGQRV